LNGEAGGGVGVFVYKGRISRFARKGRCFVKMGAPGIPEKGKAVGRQVCVDMEGQQRKRGLTNTSCIRSIKSN